MAVERFVPLEAICQESESRIEGLTVQGVQSETSSEKQQGIDAEAQSAASDLDRFLHESGPLAEQIHHKITRRSESLHII
jgi:hypothetical protein